ncbi:MAG: hypothetical protein MI739_12870 [Bacteroidales bacterium]|nr:hypothetical protein [Bacteroidales bacterium]
MKNFYGLILGVFLVSNNLFGQGCSDAGVCSINIMKNQSTSILEKPVKNAIEAGLVYGIGDFDIQYLTPYVEYSGRITNKFGLAAKLIYTYISGEITHIDKLSDLIFVADYILMQKEFSSISAIAGIKIPLDDSNIEKDGEVLPMHYQSSLGTYDLVLGLNYLNHNLGINLALQQPIVNINQNSFFAPHDNLNSVEYKYYTTNMFERKGDIVNRISYNFPILNKKLFFRPSILSIYHLANDEYTDRDGVKKEIENSRGITMNANIFLNYYFATTKQLELSVGFPFLIREARPAGLTRELVIALEYQIRF